MGDAAHAPPVALALALPSTPSGASSSAPFSSSPSSLSSPGDSTASPPPPPPKPAWLPSGDAYLTGGSYWFARSQHYFFRFASAVIFTGLLASALSRSPALAALPATAVVLLGGLMASIALPDAHVFAALLAPLYQLGASLSLAAVPAAACCLARDPGCPRHAALSPLVFGGVFVVDVALFGASVRFRPILGVVVAVAEMVAVLVFFVGRRERLDRVTWLGGDSATRAVVLYAVLWAPAAAAVVVLLPEATRLLARRCYRGGGDGAVPDGALPEEV